MSCGKATTYQRLRPMLVGVWLFTSSLFGDSIEMQSNGVPNGGIVVTPGDADRDDWGKLDIPTYELDPTGDAGPELDYIAVFVANDDENLYFRFALLDTTPETPEFFGFRHNVYLDTDRDRETGFYGSGNFLAVGADYLLQGPTLYEFAGADAEAWGWAEVGTGVYDDTTPGDIEAVFSLEWIDQTPEFDFVINGANSDFTTEDFLPDGAAAGELGDYFTYELGFAESPSLEGDFDGDQAYSCSDVDRLVREIIAGTNGAAFDLNFDGGVDQVDLGIWLSVAGSYELGAERILLGDANLDGNVNAQDLNSIGLNWQSSPDSWCGGDFNADGAVDAADLNLVGVNWQRDGAAAASPVPEPGCWLYSLGVAVVMLVVRRDCSGLVKG